MTFNECLQWAQKWAVRINDDEYNPYECWFESSNWLQCALCLAEEDERKWVFECMYAVTAMFSIKMAAKTYTPKLKPISGRSATMEPDEYYHFKYRGLNEPDKRGNQ